MGQWIFALVFTRVCNAGAKAIRYYLSKIPEGMDRDLRKASIDAINEVNQHEYEEYKDPEILSRISQYEMAYQNADICAGSNEYK